MKIILTSPTYCSPMSKRTCSTHLYTHNVALCLYLQLLSNL